MVEQLNVPLEEVLELYKAMNMMNWFVLHEKYVAIVRNVHELYAGVSQENVFNCRCGTIAGKRGKVLLYL